MERIQKLTMGVNTSSATLSCGLSEYNSSVVTLGWYQEGASSNLKAKLSHGFPGDVQLPVTPMCALKHGQKKLFPHRSPHRKFWIVLQPKAMRKGRFGHPLNPAPNSRGERPCLPGRLDALRWEYCFWRLN